MDKEELLGEIEKFLTNSEWTSQPEMASPSRSIGGTKTLLR
jgi:hypothetical protein